MKGNHLTQMLLGGAGILAMLLVAGVSPGTALTFAVLLACPLMMFAMMSAMGRGIDEHGGGGGHGDCGDDHRPGGADEAQHSRPKTDRELKAIDAEWRR